MTDLAVQREIGNITDAAVTITAQDTARVSASMKVEMRSTARTWARFFFFVQAEDGIRVIGVTGVQTCALPICLLATSPGCPHLMKCATNATHHHVQHHLVPRLLARKVLLEGTRRRFSRSEYRRRSRRGKIGRASCRERV